MRFLAHAGLVLILLISFSRAPHDHFHPADPDHAHSHHERAHVAVHHSSELELGELELGELELGELELEAPDHDSTARFKDWLAGDGKAAAKQYAETATANSVAGLVQRRRPVTVLSVRNHDPPTIFIHPARPPPHSSHL
jgi:hypothetical protein